MKLLYKQNIEVLPLTRNNGTEGQFVYGLDGAPFLALNITSFCYKSTIFLHDVTYSLKNKL